MTDHASLSSARAPIIPRRWFQLRLATVLVAKAALCVWLAFYVNRGHREKRAIAALQKGGVYVTTASSIPGWAPTWLGNSFFQYVIAVNCCDYRNRRENDFGHVDDPSEPLSGLELFFVIQPYQGDRRHDGRLVTDALMSNITAFEYCKVLDLQNAKLTDAGVEHLAQLRQVQALYIGGTKITDAGLKHISGMKQLRHLDLSRTSVTDEGVEELQRAIPGCYIVR